MASRSAYASDRFSSSATGDALAALAPEALALAGMASAARGGGPPPGSWRYHCPPGGTVQPSNSASSAKAACGLVGLSKEDVLSLDPSETRMVSEFSKK